MVVANRAVFLDRDGVLNHLVDYGGGFVAPRSFDDFVMYDGVSSGLKDLSEHDFLLVVVTNQPDIERGLIKDQEISRMHEEISRQAPIDLFMVCPHRSETQCDCRKPKIGLLVKASQQLEIAAQGSFLIGDRETDMQAAEAFGCCGILLRRDFPQQREVGQQIVVNCFEDAVQVVLRKSEKWVSLR